MAFEIRLLEGVTPTVRLRGVTEGGEKVDVTVADKTVESALDKIIFTVDVAVLGAEDRLNLQEAISAVLDTLNKTDAVVMTAHAPQTDVPIPEVQALENESAFVVVDTDVAKAKTKANKK